MRTGTLAGQELGNGYRAIELIDADTFGELWRAESSCQTAVFARVITDETSIGNRDHIHRYLQKVKSLDHPHLLATLDHMVIDAENRDR